MRSKLASEKGYTATVGISTNKVLAKLVGNLNKPDEQTTLLPPYTSGDENPNDNATLFMDDHEVGKVPGIGFKIAQKLRAYVLQRPPDFDTGLVYGGTKERVLVRDVRQYPGMGPEILERLLGGAGASHGIGTRIWELLNGCDSTEVGHAREVPTQISIEDSYLRLDTLSAVTKELHMLATSLIQRMHTDLLEDEEVGDDVRDVNVTASSSTSKRWLAHPKTIRLSTRPRPAQNPDGSRNRSFARISRSAPMPSFVFSLKDSSETIVERLVNKVLLPLFRRLHSEKSGWNLSLVNVAAANMADTAREKGGVGRDISKMFRQQDETLKQWRVEETPGNTFDETPEGMHEETTQEQVRCTDDICTELPLRTEQPELPSYSPANTGRVGSEDMPTPSQQTNDHLDHIWDSGDSGDEQMGGADSYRCETCGATMPLFAMFAHERYHKSL
jgi:DNA polymerase iota